MSPALKQQIAFRLEGYRLIRTVDLLLDDDVPPGNLREGTLRQILIPRLETRAFNAGCAWGRFHNLFLLPLWLLRLFYDSAVSRHNRTG